MTLIELAESLGIAPRQIRFMIAEGILPAANKTGRAADAYGPEHLLSAQRYLALHRLGMKPASIKVLMAFDSAVPIVQVGGVELRVDQSVAPTAIDVEQVLAAIAVALRTYVKGE
jgi:DNA-binding transcriptional MerR regulator